MIKTTAHLQHFIDTAARIDTVTKNSSLSIASVMTPEMHEETMKIPGAKRLGMEIHDLSNLGVPMFAISYKAVEDSYEISDDERVQVMGLLGDLNGELAHKNPGYVYGTGVNTSVLRYDEDQINMIKVFHKMDAKLDVTHVMGVMTFTKAK